MHCLIVLTGLVVFQGHIPEKVTLIQIVQIEHKIPIYNIVFPGGWQIDELILYECLLNQSLSQHMYELSRWLIVALLNSHYQTSHIKVKYIKLVKCGV
jgi:hypothetical protein